MAGVKPLLETVGALLPRIKAWHASPHDFDKVDLSKIGTGQGAASYGPGFYAAESPKVSGVGGEYWREFSQRFMDDPAQKGAIGFIDAADGDRARAIAESAKNLEANKAWLANPSTRVSAEERAYIEKLTAERQAAHDLLVSGNPVGARVYELNIKADPQSFLQWDKPLTQQSKNVQDYTYSALPHMRDAPEASGRSFFEVHEKKLRGDDYSKEGQMRAMEGMRDAGIPGVRYADQMSRGGRWKSAVNEALASNGGDTQKAIAETEEKLAYHTRKYGPGSTHVREWGEMLQELKQPRTYNYSINNPDIIEIMRKLAIPGMVTGGAASVYQPQGQQ